jgi:hypothetical protein
MMLLTVTFEPPNCWAMLPQKFSVATTWTTDPLDSAAFVEQPEPAAATSTNSAASP